MLNKVQERVIKWFNNYFIIVSAARQKIIQRGETKILTPKQLLKILSIALAYVKAVNTSENGIHQIKHSLYQAYKITKKVCKNKMKKTKTINSKYQLLRGVINFNYLMDHVLYQNIVLWNTD